MEPEDNPAPRPAKRARIAQSPAWDAQTLPILARNCWLAGMTLEEFVPYSATRINALGLVKVREIWAALDKLTLFTPLWKG